MLYLSGTTFFTVGFGDVTPRGGLGRFLCVTEGATGFSFLAIIISYLPTIFTAFAQRETEITLLDARAGSPPSAIELLRRLGPGEARGLDELLREWERWSADVLESQLSYPVLSFFRSQHENQSWLSALTLMLDACSLVIVGIAGPTGPFPCRQARLTFAMARHTVGDLSQILRADPEAPGPDRLSPYELAQLRLKLAAAGMPLRDGPDADRQLAALRRLYEPYVSSMARRLMLALPPWLPDENHPDDWETTAWQWDRAEVVAAMRRAGGE
jgi:hypothetical protein